jgi:hypothetical protein
MSKRWVKTIAYALLVVSPFWMVSACGSYATTWRARHEGVRAPDPAAGKTFMLDVSSRRSPGLVVYVTHDFYITYWVFTYLLIAGLGLSLCFVVLLLVSKWRQARFAAKNANAAFTDV